MAYPDFDLGRHSTIWKERANLLALEVYTHFQDRHQQDGGKSFPV